MAAHDTRVVNASGKYNNSGSNHDETRPCFKYSCGDISFCGPAAKNITRLTAANTAARLYCAIAKRRVTAGVAGPDATVVIITQLPAAHATNASGLNNPIAKLGHCITVSIRSVNGCQLSAATRTRLPDA